MLRSDAGSATVWVLACCLVLLTLSGAVTLRTVAVLARHRAETAADLAALAAAARIGVAGDSCAVAARIAAGNGASLTSCELATAAGGRTGTVRVAVAEQVRLPIAGTHVVAAVAVAGRLPAAGGASP